MTAAGVATPALALPHRLSLWARVQKQDGAREQPATPDGKKKKRARARLPAGRKHEAPPESEELSALDRFAAGGRFDECARSEVGTATTNPLANRRLEVWARFPGLVGGGNFCGDGKEFSTHERGGGWTWKESFLTVSSGWR